MASRNDSKSMLQTTCREILTLILLIYQVSAKFQSHSGLDIMILFATILKLRLLQKRSVRESLLITIARVGPE